MDRIPLWLIMLEERQWIQLKNHGDAELLAVGLQVIPRKLTVQCMGTKVRSFWLLGFLTPFTSTFLPLALTLHCSTGDFHRPCLTISSCILPVPAHATTAQGGRREWGCWPHASLEGSWGELYP